MRSFPTAYRAAARSRQRAKALPPNLPPLGLGPLAGIAVAGWAFSDLLRQVDWSLPGTGGPMFQQFPASYGWTLQSDCGRQPERVAFASWAVCTAQVVSKSAWETMVPLSATTRAYWLRSATYNAVLLRYENCLPAQRWVKGLSGATFAPWVQAPAIARPVTTRTPVQVRMAALGLSERAYEPRDSIGPRPAAPFAPPRAEPVIRTPIDMHDETIVRRPTRALNVPRAVPIARTVAELKIGSQTAAGRAFLAMYAAFNFLGDWYGFSRALWKAIPRAHRGRSMRIGNMGRDIFDYMRHLGTAGATERANYLLAAGSYTALWKAQDAGWGGLQSLNFQAMGQAGNFNAARFASTVDSASRYGIESIRRASQREQSNTRMCGGR